jgi:hypothetical protein
MQKAVVCLLAIASTAGAAGSLPIESHDIPGTNGTWQESVSVIPASATQVRRWLIDYDHWSQLFSDITDARLLGYDTSGSAIVRFHSRIADRTLVIYESQHPWGLAFAGGSKHVNFRGKIFIEPLGPERTRVRMQSAADVHGMLRAFVTLDMKRAKSRAMMRANLESLHQLSRDSALGLDIRANRQ